MKRWFPILIVVRSIAVLLGGKPLLRTGAVPYTPQTRHITLIPVPVFTKELRPISPFLSRDFAQGGVLQGKQVSRFQPETLTVSQADTANIVFVNPEDDAHTFVLKAFHVALAPSVSGNNDHALCGQQHHTIAFHLWYSFPCLLSGGITSGPAGQGCSARSVGFSLADLRFPSWSNVSGKNGAQEL